MTGMTAIKKRSSSAKPPIPKASIVREQFLFFPYFPFNNVPFLLENKRHACKRLLFTICTCTIGYFSSVSYTLVYCGAEGDDFLQNSRSFQDLLQILRLRWFIKDPYTCLHSRCSSCSKLLKLQQKVKQCLCKSVILVSPLLLLRTNSSMITVQTIFRIK